MNQKAAIISAQMRHMLNVSNISIATSTLLALVLAYIQRGLIPSAAIVFWISVIAVVAIFRVTLAYVYKHSPVEEYSALCERLLKFRFGVLAAGIAWGMAGVLLFPENNAQHQMFLLFMLAGLTAGGVVAYSADIVSAISYSVSTLTPLTFRLFVSVDPLLLAMGLALLLYLVFMVISLRYICKSVMENILLRLDAMSREELVRTNEERYRLLFNNSPFPMWVIESSTLRFMDVNERAVEHYGYSHEEFGRMTLRDIRPLEDMPELDKLVSSLSNGRISGELRHKKKDGTFVEVAINSVSINYGGIPARIGIVQDITENKLANQTNKRLTRAFRLLSRCGSVLVHADNEQTLLNEICQLVVEIGGYTMAWVGFAEMDKAKSVRPEAVVGFEVGYLEEAKITWDDTERGKGPVGTAIRTSSTVVIHEFQTNPKTTPWHESAIKRGYHSCLALPLFANEQVLGALTIYSADPFAFVKEEVELLEAFASDLSFGIQTLRTRVNHEKYRYTLKKEVEKNIALLRNASDGIHIFDFEGNLIEVSDSFCSMLGYKREELIGMHVSQWDANMSYEKLMSDIKDQFTRKIRNQFETRHRQKNGTIIDVEVSSFPLELDGKYVLFNSSRDISERKQAESQLQIAATAFDSQEGMLITDANSMILRVNQAFTAITGYAPEEVIGKNPRILNSGRQDADFYAAMWGTINRCGKWNGEIWNRRKNGEIYPEYLTITVVKDRAGNTTNYVATINDVTQRKNAENEINNLAFYDPLTHLPNRRLLIDRLKHALSASARSGQQGALLFIDLDNFKILNDTLGHDIGDLLLQQAAQRLQSCVREGDTVARLGGDEFVVMLENLSEDSIESAAQSELVSVKILEELSQIYQLGLNKHHCTSSIGATLFKSHECSIDDLFKQAEIAMYQSKKSGRNTLRYFDPKMQEAINTRASLESELRKAIENRQFHLHFQIQIDSLHRPLGAEALIRWIHPERGSISPAQFIPLAEETGLILPIGQWVLETACAQLKAWEKNALTRTLVLAVNVSAKQFRQDYFVEDLKAAVQFHAINPSLLKLELTESMLLENIEETITNMTALKTIGVQISLDDFGTGYSSLQYLKRLPLDQLKIDQSFIREIATDNSDLAIMRTIISMAHSLDLDVIAEGVETEDQLQILLNHGCTHYQGYLFSKPVPIKQFEKFLKLGWEPTVFKYDN